MEAAHTASHDAGKATCLLILCSWCVPATTLKKGVRLLSSHAKIRKINVNAQKTQVIALKVIKCYSLPCTIKVLIGILYRQTQISNKILPWDMVLGDQGGNTAINEQWPSLGTQGTHSRKTTLCVWSWLVFLNIFLVFSVTFISLWTKISAQTRVRCKDNH